MEDALSKELLDCYQVVESFLTMMKLMNYSISSNFIGKSLISDIIDKQTIPKDYEFKKRFSVGSYSETIFFSNMLVLQCDITFYHHNSGNEFLIKVELYNDLYKSFGDKHGYDSLKEVEKRELYSNFNQIKDLIDKIIVCA